MDIADEKVGKVTVVSIAGKVDTKAAPDFQKHLEQLVEGGSNELLVDLSKTSLVTSAGLRVLLGMLKQLKGSGGVLKLCCMNEVVKEVFNISGFNTIMNAFDTKDLALKDF